jgi:hypothetical protein
MLRHATFLLLLLLSYDCSGQKQGNVWYFGIGSGLDFSNNIPVSINTGLTGSDIGADNQEGTSCISDSSGKILFYTGGETIWNRNHIAMPNGNSLFGRVSSTQSSLIVPLPGSDSIFYVFTSDEFQSYHTLGLEKGYRFSVVNMCLDNGLGDVILNTKNTSLLDSSTEKLAACEDASGNGYWIMGHKMFSTEFSAWHLTSGGITSTVVTSIGTLIGWDFVHSTWVYSPAQGQMKFNSIGTKLALAINSDPAVLDILDFNSNTGNVSNCRHIVLDSLLHKSIYGIEFSPDNSKLYVGVTGGSGGKRLYQFNLNAGSGNRDSIFASQKTLFQSNTNSFLFGMQLAPDNKIYLYCNSDHDLGRINFPNASGSAAGFDSISISISGNGGMTLPSFISGYKYHNTIPFCSSIVGLQELTNSSFISDPFPNPTKGYTTIDYSFPDGINNGEILLYNIVGKEVKRLRIDAAIKPFLLSTSDLPTGTYYYQLQTANNTSAGKKLVVIK